MRNQLLKLLDVKSIITIILAGGVTWGFTNGIVTPQEYLTLVTMAFTFYFSYQAKKGD